MMVVEYLSQAFYIDLRLKGKLDRLESLKSLAEKVTAALNATPVSGTRDVHKLDKVVCKIVDLENEINKEIDALVDLKRDIRLMIDSVPCHDCRVVLELRYLNYMKWHQIAESMDRGIRAVHYIHAKAIAFLEEENE
jgi:hypothetical protein